MEPVETAPAAAVMYSFGDKAKRIVVASPVEPMETAPAAAVVHSFGDKAKRIAVVSPVECAKPSPGLRLMTAQPISSRDTDAPGERITLPSLPRELPTILTTGTHATSDSTTHKHLVPCENRDELKTTSPGTERDILTQKRKTNRTTDKHSSQNPGQDTRCTNFLHNAHTVFKCTANVAIICYILSNEQPMLFNYFLSFFPLL